MSGGRDDRNPDNVLAAEREHLHQSRAFLELMRTDVLSLRAMGGDPVSEEYLKADLYRRAAGSASELTTALRIARARGYISVNEHDAVERALDRVRAMLWRLTH